MKKVIVQPLLIITIILKWLINWGIPLMVALVTFYYIYGLYKDRGLFCAAATIILALIKIGLLHRLSFQADLVGMAFLILTSWLLKDSREHFPSLPEHEDKIRWYKEHLNWTMIYSWLTMTTMFIVVLFLTISFSRIPYEPWTSVAEWTLIFFMYVVFSLLIVVIGWAIKQKNRSLWFLLLLLLYWGIIVLVILDSRPKITVTLKAEIRTEPQKTPTLAETFMIPVIQPLIKEPLFGKQWIPLSTFLAIGAYLFETGALLGWAYRDRQFAFIRVISPSDTPDQLVGLVRLKAKERVAEWKSADDSFWLFVYETELARRGHPISMMPSDNISPIEGNEKWMGNMNWIKKQSLDLHIAWSDLHSLFYEGIGHGFEFPDETQRRWKVVYEKPKTPQELISWHMAYQYGVVTTPEPEILMWDERVSEVKDVLKEYITEFKPALNTLFTE